MPDIVFSRLTSTFPEENGMIFFYSHKEIRFRTDPAFFSRHPTLMILQSILYWLLVIFYFIFSTHVRYIIHVRF